MNKENLLKELKEEILNKEFTLLDLDNKIEKAATTLATMMKLTWMKK